LWFAATQPHRLQAPEEKKAEEEIPVAAEEPDGSSTNPASRFDYDAMLQAEAPTSKAPLKRGKDGHLTLDSDGVPPGMSKMHVGPHSQQWMHVWFNI
jgi:hypothetical protein